MDEKGQPVPPDMGDFGGTGNFGLEVLGLHKIVLDEMTRDLAGVEFDEQQENELDRDVVFEALKNRTMARNDANIAVAHFGPKSKVGVVELDIMSGVAVPSRAEIKQAFAAFDNIPFGDDKEAYVTARSAQIIKILWPSQIREIAIALEPKLATADNTLWEARTLQAAEKLAKAEFTTHTQHDLSNRGALVQALKKPARKLGATRDPNDDSIVDFPGH